MFPPDIYFTNKTKYNTIRNLLLDFESLIIYKSTNNENREDFFKILKREIIEITKIKFLD